MRRPLIPPGSRLPQKVTEPEPDLQTRIVERALARGTNPTPEPEKIETTGLQDYQTTSIPDYETTSSPVVQTTEVSTKLNVPEIPVKVDGRKRKPFRAFRLEKPDRPLTDREAKQQLLDALHSESTVINFKGPSGLNDLLDNYLAEYFRECRRDDVKKQDLIARAIKLIGYEILTGRELVDFGDEE